MKSGVSPWTVAATLLLIASSSACASSPLHSPPPPPATELRTLRLDPETGKFRYAYLICSKVILGICTETQQVVEWYDMGDPGTRKDLSARGFVLMVEPDRPIP